MTTLAEWIRQVKAEEDAKEPALVIKMRRILTPGFQPLKAEGFIRFDGGQAIHRVGMPPEAMAVAFWAEKGKPDQLAFDDLGMNLGAGLSLISDRRVEVLNEFPVSAEDQHTFISFSEIADRRLVSPIKNTNLEDDFKKLVGNLASLSGRKERAITVAIQLHYGAVLLFDRDLAAAYTLVVAGLETLAQQFGDVPKDWADWEMADDWNAFAKKQGLTTAQHEALRAKLMQDKQLRLKERFANYAGNHLPRTFWSRSWEEHIYRVQDGSWKEGQWQPQKQVRDHLPRDRKLLVGTLRKSYDARSSFVHSGQRTVDLYSQFQFHAGTQPVSIERPLPFALLRSILTTLIEVELAAHSKDYEVPEIRMTG
jgi:hypothetical protein